MKFLLIITTLMAMGRVAAQSQWNIITPSNRETHIVLTSLEVLVNEDSTWKEYSGTVLAQHQTKFYRNEQGNFWHQYFHTGLGIMYLSKSELEELKGWRFNPVFESPNNVIGYSFLVKSDKILELKNSETNQHIKLGAQHEIVMKFENGTILSCDDRFFLGKLYDSEESFEFENEKIENWEVIVPIEPER